MIFLLFSFVNISGIFGQDAVVFTNLQWLHDNAEITEACIYDEIKISFETQDISDNESLNIEIWENSDNQLTDLIEKVKGTVKNGKVEIIWTVKYDENNKDAKYYHEIQDTGYTILDYIFVVNYKNIKKNSKILEINAWGNRQIVDDKTGEVLRNRDYALLGPDGKWITGKTDNDGRIILRNLRKIGEYRLII
jgi:hypothetical protein